MSAWLRVLLAMIGAALIMIVIFLFVYWRVSLRDSRFGRAALDEMPVDAGTSFATRKDWTSVNKRQTSDERADPIHHLG